MNICVQTMVIVQIHKIVIGKRHLPSPPGPMLVSKVKCKFGSVQMIINIDLGEGGGGAWFSIYRRKLDVWINCTPVVPVILARIVVYTCRHFSNLLQFPRNNDSKSKLAMTFVLNALSVIFLIQPRFEAALFVLIESCCYVKSRLHKFLSLFFP